MPNYFAAAQRHLSDGDLLATHTRAVNAVHLWAYGAECLLKAIALKQAAFSLDARGRPDAGFAQHLNEVRRLPNDLISMYNALQQGPQALLAPTGAFACWTVESRYEDGSAITPHFAQCSNDAKAFSQLLQQAIQQGVLP